jgi:hypothetical protein
MEELEAREREREREREKANVVVGEGTSDLRGGFAAKCKGGRKVISLPDNSERRRRQYISLLLFSIPTQLPLSPRSATSLPRSPSSPFIISSSLFFFIFFFSFFPHFLSF